MTHTILLMGPKTKEYSFTSFTRPLNLSVQYFETYCEGLRKKYQGRYPSLPPILKFYYILFSCLCCTSLSPLFHLPNLIHSLDLGINTTASRKPRYPRLCQGLLLYVQRTHWLFLQITYHNCCSNAHLCYICLMSAFTIKLQQTGNIGNWSFRNL